MSISSIVRPILQDSLSGRIRSTSVRSLACRDPRRINGSAAFFVSIEFQETGYLVYKANQAAFNSGEQLRLQSFLPDTQEIGRGFIFGQPGADDRLEMNKRNFFIDFVQRPAFLAPNAYPATLSGGGVRG